MRTQYFFRLWVRRFYLQISEHDRLPEFFGLISNGYILISNVSTFRYSWTAAFVRQIAWTDDT